MRQAWVWALLASLLLHGVLLLGVDVPQHTAAPSGQTAPLTVALEAPPAAPTLRTAPVKSTKPVGPIKSVAPTGADHAYTAHSTVKAAVTSPPALTDDLRSRSLQMARQETQDPNAGQRVRAITPQNRDTVFGSYEEAFGRKVEAVGTVNYPPPVNGHSLYGSVRLTATIGPDGKLVQVDIRTSSGNGDLDQAARRIVQMASPFQPFSEAMRAETDLVSITRTFNFTHAGNAISSGQ